MNIRQFKLTNNDEIVCEVIDVDKTDNQNGDIIARKILKVFHAEDFDQFNNKQVSIHRYSIYE